MINTVIPLKRRSARTADLKLILLLLGLMALSAGARAQCLQEQPNSYYTRVISSTNLDPGSFIQSDYNADDDHIYVPSTFGTTAFPTDAYLTRIHGKGYMDNGWGKRYPQSGNERCLATRYTSSKDIAMAGTTKGSGGTNKALYVMMVKDDGTFLWGRYFDQDFMDADYRVLITETTYKDIVVVASSLTGNHQVVIRLDHYGTLYYYFDRPLTIGPDPIHNYAVINGLIPTSDNGYVAVGATGNIGDDYYAATAIKFDANYTAGGGHTVDWRKTYRRPLATYDLTDPDPALHSSTVAKGGMEDPGTDKDIVVVGYQGDHDLNFANGSYQKGFIWILDAALGTQKYLFDYDLPGNLVTFNAICADSDPLSDYNYIVTGSVSDFAGNTSQTLLSRIEITSTTNSNVLWTNLYGTNRNEGFQVFYKNHAGVEAYISVGLSNENPSGTMQSHVIAVDMNGAMGALSCAANPTLIPDDVDNAPVGIRLGTIAEVAPADIYSSPYYHCETMGSPCGSNCEQQSDSAQYFSRVLTSHINQEFLKADFDATGAQVYVPANYDGGIGLNDVLWSKVDLTTSTNGGNVNISNQYNITGTEKTRAVVHAYNGDIVTAGTTVKGGRNVLFILRTDSLGGIKWYHYYNQSTTDVTYYPVMTETTNHDIVVAASSWTGSNNHILLRVDEFGAMEYYDDHAVFANGNGVQYYPFINDITATYDNGYVIVGSTGHNFDFNAATAYKYDAAYAIPANHVKNWHYIFRRNLFGPYNLNNPNQRSSSEGQGVTEDPVTHDIIIVGNTSNAGAAAYTATFQWGFLTKLTATGTFLDQRVYFNSYAFHLNLNDVIVDANGDYIVTGDAFDPNHWWYRTLIARFDQTTLNADWGYLYGSIGKHRGFSIFENPGVGYVSVGVTNYVAPEFYTVEYPVGIAVYPPPNGWGVTAPNVISVDYSGTINTNECYSAIYLAGETITNSPVSLTEGTFNSATSSTDPVNTPSTCVFMTEQCNGPLYIYQMMVPEPDEDKYAPEDKIDPGVDPAERNILDIEQPDGQDNSVKLYPNPATDNVKLEITSGVDGAAQITVQDITGKTLSVRNIQIVNGVSRFDLDISDLTPGTYLIHISGSDLKTNFPVTRIQKY